MNDGLRFLPWRMFRRLTGDRRLFAPVAVFLSALLQGCSPLVTANTLLVGSASLAQSDISYTPDRPHERRRLDVYVPSGAGSCAGAEADGAPVVLFLYGGSWKSGDRSAYRFVGDALARRGIVTVIPDYRLHPEVSFPAFVNDGADALGWTYGNIARFGGDPGRIVVAGHSAGAHIAAMLAFDDRYLEGAGLRPDMLRGFIGLAGPYSFNPVEYPSTRSVFADIADDPDRGRPVSFVTAGAPAVRLFHGADDETVLPQNSDDLAEALRDAGVAVDHTVYPGTGHIGLVAGFFPMVGIRSAIGDDVAAAVRAMTAGPGPEDGR